MTALSVEQTKQTITESEDLIILDTRDNETFAEGFITGSIFIGLNDRFEDWALSLIPSGYSILLVTPPGEEDETAHRLKKAGFNKIIGYLAGGIDAWKNAGEITDLIIQVEADELAMDIPFDDNLIVIDVRNEAAYAEGHVKDALNIPLKTMTDPGVLAILEDNDNLYIHCQAGDHSLIAVSLIKRQGLHNLRHLAGGWESIVQEKRIETEKDNNALN
jgi:rhodanese-related sulfurtransferase